VKVSIFIDNIYVNYCT